MCVFFTHSERPQKDQRYSVQIGSQYWAAAGEVCHLGNQKKLCVVHCFLLVTLSTAQLLEPFCREHGISMPAALSGELDRAPGGHPSMMHQNVGSLTHNLEDPPGLYEKVSTASSYQCYSFAIVALKKWVNEVLVTIWKRNVS